MGLLISAADTKNRDEQLMFIAFKYFYILYL
jgi:hypothetical protein